MPSKGQVTRQAVLLIHGIGEQKPMDTLRGFVRTMWRTDESVQRQHGSDRDGVWSKPYTLSENFELRLLTTAENAAGIRTDFYEFYWAHLMQGTKIGHVVAWAKTLLLRRPWSVPRHLRLAYWVLVALVAAAVYLAATGVFQNLDNATPWLRYAISLLLIPLGTWLLTAIVGDAARYLHVAPENVQTRNEIRAAGVEVLKALHDAKYRYQRIVVVGHSLGTVIGYDMLKYAWPLFDRQSTSADTHSCEALDELEALARSQLEAAASPTIETVQTAQRGYFNELRSNTVPWCVTDFITLGSPLAHAAILLARNEAELETRIAEREFPTCLPSLEYQQVDHERLGRFSYPANSPARKPHHAAMFAPTRWTNLYFPCRLIVWGDLIGGPLAGLFGAGIRDIAVATKRRFGFLSHTLYWEPDKGANQHIQALRTALDLLDSRSGP